ncbi:unnamed protein product [Owenia fusiformis]|uniref:Transmembrane protein 237 n=1 Tax=Owenia fusiformis TaxID=6347 RepID=A0A8S4P0L7_OWEFU|nr:unnamed protein product [Owenia fusiformis]
MADEIPKPKARKLPPLSPSVASQRASEAEDVTPRKKKKKKRIDGEESGQDSVRSVRRRSRSRERISGAEGTLDSPSTPSKNRRKRVKDTTGDDGGEESQPATPSSATRKDRRSGRKPKQNVSGSRETLVDDTVTESKADPTTKKKRKKRKKPDGSNEPDEYEDNALAAELSAINDDIITKTEDHDEDDDDDERDVRYTAPQLKSQPVGRLFIEQKTGFKSTDKHKLARRLAEQQEQARSNVIETPGQTTIQLAISTHRVFKAFTLFLHGILAGFAIWHIVTVYILLGHGNTDFLLHYAILGQPVQSIYYLMFALCIVSVFDRYDVSHPNRRFLIKALTLQSGAVSVLVYFIGLVLNLSIAALDDRIGLYTKYPNLWQDEQLTATHLDTWKILNVLRGTSAILGWFILSIQPTKDRLSKNLANSDENLLGGTLEMVQVNGK